MKRPLIAALALLTVQAFAAGWRAETIPLKGVTLNHPFGIIRGPGGCIYFCEIDGNVVRKIDLCSLTLCSAQVSRPRRIH